jgi:bla regulator protein blaR1
MILMIHFLATFFNAAALHAVFITLVHSLWMGAVMALVAGAAIMLTKKSEPQLRYQLLAGLLMLFVLCMLLVFFNVFIGAYHAVDNGNKTTIKVTTSAAFWAGHIQPQRNLIDTFLFLIQSNAGIIVTIWLTVIFFKCARLISGLSLLQQLKKRNAFDAGEYWNKKLHDLTLKIGVSKPVLLLQSSLAKVPMVIGHLKPVILFPIGILNALPQDEVEAVLLHELAHIKRNDFLINLLQRFIEIFFFFNPAVLWVSSLLKNERENCCDDIALSISQDKELFIHALVSFQEYQADVNFATTFPGSKNHLLDRVKRIITNKNKTLNNMEKLILASGIIFTCLATLAFNPDKGKDKDDAAKTKSVTIRAAGANNRTGIGTEKIDPKPATVYFSRLDTLPRNEMSEASGYNLNFKGDVDGKRVELKEKNSKVEELYVDGKKIPEDQYKQYQPLIEKIHMQMREQAARLKLKADELELKKEQMQKRMDTLKMTAKEMKEQNELARVDMEKQKELMEQKEVEMQKSAELMQKRDSAMRLQSQKMQKDFIQKQKEFEQKELEFQKKVEELKLRQEKLKLMLIDSANATNRVTVKPAINTKPIVLAKPGITTGTIYPVTAAVNCEPVTVAGVASTVYATPLVLSKVSSKSAVSLKPVAVVGFASAVKAKPGVFNVSTGIAGDIIRDLENLNIINSRENLSFQLTNKSLIVNGIKQPEDIHQRILQKYQSKAGDKISLRYSNK